MTADRSLKLYHRRAPGFRGEILYPLHQLKDVANDVYEAQIEKYRGRESLLEQRVPFLDCRWNDVLHFSPVHPGKIKQVCEAAGLPWWPADWFECEPQAHGFDERNTAIFLYADMTVELSIPVTEFERYSPHRVSEMTEVPQRAREYVHEIAQTGQPHFIFAGVPHILHRHPLNVRQVEVIRA
jgi:hypothetical protein